MHKAIFLIFLSFYLSANCQISVDKIIVTKNLLTTRYNSLDSVYKSENKIVLNKKAISKILKELQIDKKDYLLSKYLLDTIYINKYPKKLLKLGLNKLEIDWNIKQKEFIFTELSNLNNYKKELDVYLDNGCCYTMHHFYKNEYIIDFYENSKLINQIKSRKYVWGYKFPYTDNKKNLFFNYKLDKVIEKLFFEKSKNNAPKKGKVLLKYLVNKIIENNSHDLYKLSPYTYQKEIDELKKDFNIISFEQMYAYGRYIALEKKKIIKITLHNSKMLPNVNLKFLASVDKSLYKKDSLLAKYEIIISRVQNIDFFKNYLLKNDNARIDIYFFNNKPINNYNIENINKNPTQWKKQDEYIKSLKWYEKNNIKPSFNLNEAIKISETNNCGCNYRFEKSFIEKGVFFEFFDEDGNSSIWILLPDNTILLYITDGERVLDLNFTGFKQSFGIKFPCKLFDSKGIELKK